MCLALFMVQVAEFSKKEVGGLCQVSSANHLIYTLYYIALFVSCMYSEKLIEKLWQLNVNSVKYAH